MACQDFNTVPCPTYPSIKLAVLPGEKVRRRITELAPHALHIATEGSLGWAARNYAVELGIPFTTAYHTRFPEYVQKRLFLPVRVTYCASPPTHPPTYQQRICPHSIDSPPNTLPQPILPLSQATLTGSTASPAPSWCPRP